MEALDVVLDSPGQRLVLDVCQACGGIWFDAGELGRILAGKPRPQAHNELRAPVDASDPLPCKVCRKPMARRGYPGTATQVDICQAHGAFLDQGELEDIVGRGAVVAESPEPLELAMSLEERREAVRQKRARSLAAIRVDPRTAELERVRDRVRADASSFVISLFSSSDRCRHCRHDRDSMAWDILESIIRR